MYCISTSPFYFLKGIIICIQRCIIVQKKKALDICSLPTVYQFNIDKKNLLLVSTKQKEKTTFQIFANELLVSSNTTKIGVKYFCCSN